MIVFVASSAIAHADPTSAIRSCYLELAKINVLPFPLGTIHDNPAVPDSDSMHEMLNVYNAAQKNQKIKRIKHSIPNLLHGIYVFDLNGKTYHFDFGDTLRRQGYNWVPNIIWNIQFPGNPAPQPMGVSFQRMVDPAFSQEFLNPSAQQWKVSTQKGHDGQIPNKIVIPGILTGDEPTLIYLFLKPHLSSIDQVLAQMAAKSSLTKSQQKAETMQVLQALQNCSSEFEKNPSLQTHDLHHVIETQLPYFNPLMNYFSGGNPASKSTGGH